MVTFGENLRALRLNRFLSQKEVADAVKISKSTYSHYELGERRPDMDLVYQLAQYFEVHMDVFFCHHTERLISDIEFSNAMTAQQKELLRDFAGLSELSKGKLLERLAVLQVEDEVMFARRARRQTKRKSVAPDS